MTKEEILEKNIAKAAQTKLGITYNPKIKKVALQSMQEYADQQLHIGGVSNSLSDLDGKTIPVNFKVTKGVFKVIIDNKDC